MTRDPNADLVVALVRRCMASHDIPVILPPTLYDRAAALGIDMSMYRKAEPIPTGPVKRSECKCVCHTDAVALGWITGPMHVQPCCVEDVVGNGTWHDATITPGVVVAGSMVKPTEYAASDKPRWPCPGDRKRVRYCGGVTCMPGRGGTCVACSDDD